MIKVMHLDMFYFEYKPIFLEDEKVLYKNEQIIVSLEGKEKVLSDSDILDIKFDTLFAERIQQNWTSTDLINSLKSIDSNDEEEKKKYRLCTIEPEDEITVSFDFLIKTLAKLNYNDDSFEYIAYGK